MNKNKIIMVFLSILIGIAVLGSVNIVQAAHFDQITATPSDVTANNATSYTIVFTTTTIIPNDGQIIILFPSGFDVSGASFTSWTGFDGTQTLTVASQTITITRTSGTSSDAGAKTIVLGNIINSSTIADNYQLTITTKNAADTILDGPTGTIYFQIFSSHSETDIDGIYYLRENHQTHYQVRDSIGTASDYGILSKIPPSSDEVRFCSVFVSFYFDENGTYSQVNQIENVYYHIWWKTKVNEGIVGYDEKGGANKYTSENFIVNIDNSPNKVDDRYLYAGKQTFAEPLPTLGNEIYNFTIKLSTSGMGMPIVISHPNQYSFIIINLPDNATLQSLDSDGDGLKDYNELFVYYTNPYNSDTDNDGWDDKYEIDNNLNVIDPDRPPTFGRWLLQQYDGEAVNNNFGWSVSSISDIDGDGKDDILIGAPDANSVYIYSSGSGGELIKQYNGEAGYYFGRSVSSISDIDGDGKDDILIGASGANSVYLYSSGPGGELIKQYDGVTGDSFGQFISSISDIDEDGKDDILIGAPGARPGGLYQAGSVYLYSSGTGGELIKQYDDESVYTSLGGNYFGWSVSSISDIDGDGKDDVLIGAPSANSVYIYSSGTGGELIKQYGGGAGDSFGWSVSSISDIDGDGKDDVLIGAPGANSVYIYSSGSGGELIKQYGGGAGDSFGWSVSSISDIDGDGKDDVLIGAPGANSVYIYSSGSGGELIKQYDDESVYTSLGGNYFGWSVSSISDIDGDGKDDVLIGAPGANSVYIYSSGSGGELIKQYDDESVYTSLGGNYFGWSVSSISDIDGDGKDDVLIGAYNITVGGEFYNGSAYLYSSGPGGELIRRYNGEAANDNLGQSISSISDIDGDGKDDVLIGASGAQPGGLYRAGSVYLYSSCGNIANQSWSQGNSKSNAFDLDGYFYDPNNSTLPNPNQKVTYTASTVDNPIIDVTIDVDNIVSFNQPVVCAGTETVVFTATDSTGISSQSNVVALTVTGTYDFYNDSDNNVKDWCFIATAAYGTTMSPEVMSLRKFRDEYLLTNPIGEVFVNSYYKISPIVASFINEHPVLRSMVRKTLIPLIWVSEKRNRRNN